MQRVRIVLARNVCYLWSHSDHVAVTLHLNGFVPIHQLEVGEL